MTCGILSDVPVVLELPASRQNFRVILGLLVRFGAVS
jgi:hypothetical protein